MFRRTLPVLVVLALVVACGKDSPTSPSATAGPTQSPTTTPQTPTRITVFGVVRNGSEAQPLVGASVRVTGTAGTSGTAATDGNGYYSIVNIGVGTITVAVTASGFLDHSESFSVQGNWQYDVPLRPIARYALFGVVRDSVTNQPLANVTVTGVNVLTQTNVRTTTDGGGFYHLAGIASGSVNIDWARFDYVSRSERITFENADLRRDLIMTSVRPAPTPTPTPSPSPATCGAPAVVTCINGGHQGAPTARCSDGAWSCSLTASGTCSSHGGISCRVCPGPLC